TFLSSTPGADIHVTRAPPAQFRLCSCIKPTRGARPAHFQPHVRMRVNKAREKIFSLNVYDLRIPERQILSNCQDLLPLYEKIELLHPLSADHCSAFK